MVHSPEKPWFGGRPHAPKVSHSEYLTEKAYFAGGLIGPILYGITIALFAKCIRALLSPVDRTSRSIRWGIMVHTVIMFLFVTIFVAVSFAAQPICYVDNRKYPGVNGKGPGPVGYFANIVYFKAINLIPNTMFLLNNWLADGILLHRCFALYAGSYWIIAFPCLMYLVSIGMGIMFTYVKPDNNRPTISSMAHDFGISYFSISLSLNIFLTLMIITRLVLHNMAVRITPETPTGAARIYKTIVTMLIESFALRAGSILLFIGTWASGSSVEYLFFPVLAATEVIAPFLVILRVADRRALTSDDVSSGSGSSLRFRSQANSTVDSGSLRDEYPVTSMDTNGRTHGISVEVATDHEPNAPRKPEAPWQFESFLPL